MSSIARRSPCITPGAPPAPAFLDLCALCAHRRVPTPRVCLTPTPQSSTRTRPASPGPPTASSSPVASPRAPAARRPAPVPLFASHRSAAGALRRHRRVALPATAGHAAARPAVAAHGTDPSPPPPKPSPPPPSPPPPPPSPSPPPPSPSPPPPSPPPPPPQPKPPPQKSPLKPRPPPFPPRPPPVAEAYVAGKGEMRTWVLDYWGGECGSDSCIRRRYDAENGEWIYPTRPKSTWFDTLGNKHLESNENAFCKTGGLHDESTIIYDAETRAAAHPPFPTPSDTPLRSGALSAARPLDARDRSAETPETHAPPPPSSLSAGCAAASKWRGSCSRRPVGRPRQRTCTTTPTTCGQERRQPRRRFGRVRRCPLLRRPR